jgi:DNA-binding MarR family transcriptional regulator
MSEKDEIAVSQTLTPEQQAVWDAKAKVRVLLNLWDLGGGKMKVKKGDLTKRIVRTNETSQRYVEVLGELQATGAIEYSLVNRVTLVELTAKGKEVLAQGLKSRDSLFEFDGSQIGTRLGNSLLKWIRHQDGAASVAVEKGKADVGTIAD